MREALVDVLVDDVRFVQDPIAFDEDRLPALQDRLDPGKLLPLVSGDADGQYRGDLPISVEYL